MTNHQYTEGERADMFSEFHSEHLRRQTKAIETIRSILVTWLVLTIIGAVFIVVAVSQSTGY